MTCDLLTVNLGQDEQHEDGGTQPPSLHPGQSPGVPAVPQVSPGSAQVRGAELPGGGRPAEEGEHHLHQPGQLAGRDQPLQVGQCEVQPQSQTPSGESSPGPGLEIT